MGAKEDKENVKIDNLYSTVDKDKRKKVVVLAEDPFEGRDRYTSEGNFPRDALYERHTSEGNFPRDARTWAKDNPNFDVVVIPYYTEWKGHTLEDVNKKLQEIEGNYTLGFMGHQGFTMGGYPISPLVLESDKKNRLSRIYHQQEMLQETENRAVPSTADFTMPSSSALNQSRIKTDREAIVKSIDNNISKTEKRFENAMSITDLINANSGNINNVMIGACNMGVDDMPKVVQNLSTTTNKTVYCQGLGSWGTGDIKSTGENPWQNFFISGKPFKRTGDAPSGYSQDYEAYFKDIPDVGAMIFSPNENPVMMEERHQTGRMSLTSDPHSLSGRIRSPDLFEGDLDRSRGFGDNHSRPSPYIYSRKNNLNFSVDEVSNQMETLQTYNDSLYSRVKYNKDYLKSKSLVSIDGAKEVTDAYAEREWQLLKLSELSELARKKALDKTKETTTVGSLSDYFRQYD